MRYANIQRAFSLIFRILSLNSYARYYRSFKYCNKVLPVYLIHRCIIIVYHANLAMVFRHEHVNIAVQRVTVVSTADYLTDTLSFASHVMKLRKVVEVVKAVDAQHKTSSFSTSVFSP